MRRLHLAAALALAGMACMVGPSTASFAPANTPAGGTVTVKTKVTAYTGELLALEDSSALLVQHGTLTRVPVRLIRAVDAPYGGGSGQPDSTRRERLRLISRYPKGVPPELERRLLDAYHQAAVTIVSE